MSPVEREAGSFRDPSGFVFFRDGGVYRQINLAYQEDYDHFLDSGLYQELVASDLIIEHQETDLPPYDPSAAYKVIRPAVVPFISYPYEWCFSQYKDAALATIEVLKRALAHGMILKDASAYNIQFLGGKPRLIDTLSFEIYREGRPWDGYQQFCKHFFAPLLLMESRDARLQALMRPFIDGIPLEIASSLLPFRTRFDFPVLAHIHLHAKAQQKATQGRGSAPGTADAPRPGLRKEGILSIAASLAGRIRRLDWSGGGTSWGDYSQFHTYSEQSYQQKLAIVEAFISEADPKSVWDLGANTGDFSRLASRKGIPTVSFDIDPGAVEQGYLKSAAEGDDMIHHAIIDLCNPSPSLGWNTAERKSLLERGPTDLLLALALIHHLAIGNNLSLGMISSFFAGISDWLAIEFVPKHDSQVQILLSSRRDIFPDYTMDHFEEAFARDFSILKKQPIPGSERTLYLMKKRAAH